VLVNCIVLREGRCSGNFGLSFVVVVDVEEYLLSIIFVVVDVVVVEC